MCLEGRGSALLLALSVGFGSACGAGTSAKRPAPPSPPPPASSATNTAGPRVTVRLTTPDLRPLTNGAVAITSDDRRDAAGAPAEVAIHPDGSFTFTGVTPGSYRIRARAETEGGGTPLFALYRIVVAAQDVDVRLSLLPAASLAGKLLVEAQRTAKPASLPGVEVRAPFADGTTFGDALSGEPLVDGAFTLRGLMAGHHVIAVDGLRDPWVLKEVTYRGQDITDTGLELDGGQTVEDVQVTITDVASEISGTVRDADSTGVAGAQVLIIPSAPQFWNRASRRFGRAATDNAGRYRYRGLPAGEYRVVALKIDEADIFSPGVLSRLRDAGVPLTLGSQTARVIDLRLTPSPAARPVSAR